MEDGGSNSIIMLGILIILVAIDVILTVTDKLRIVLQNKRQAKKDAEEDILIMVNESHEQGYIEASEAEMISNIFEFGDKQAKDIMTDRSNITAMDAQMTFADAIEFMLNERNSRFPVYKENLDHIVGILYLKDALRIGRNRTLLELPIEGVAGLLRTAHFIPETRKVDALFKNMRATKLQMVIVIDEYGQTSGLVAMEDILEEIVGDILDEYDEDEEYIEEKGKNKFIIDGMTPLEELEERFKISFGELPVETLNGYLISKMERIPNEKERFSITVEGYNFKIIEVENKMIKRVVVTRLPADIIINDESQKNNENL